VKRIATLYVREHVGGWTTATVLELPHYAAYGPHFSALREELSEALIDDIRAGSLTLPEPSEATPWTTRGHTFLVKAVQHERLISVPLRVLIGWRRRTARDLRFQVVVPRFDERFSIVGEENIVPWAEEVVRGHLHLKDISVLLDAQFDRHERLEDVELSFTPGKGKKTKGSTTPEGRPELPPAHPLAEFGTDLVDEASHKRLGRAFGRSEVIDRLIEILTGRQQSAAVLVGPSGVGKTAIIQELAHRIARGEVPPKMRTGIWAIPPGRFIAGARFLGEWQARAQEILRLIAGERAVLYLGHLGELIALHQNREGHGLADFLRPRIESGELTVLAEATPESLAHAERDHAPLVRTMARIHVDPLPLKETRQVVEQATRAIERSLSVELEAGALDTALGIIERHGDPDGLPGSAVALIDRVLRRTAGGGGELGRRTKKIVGASAVLEVFANLTGLPHGLIDPAKRLDVAELQRFFDQRVVGQHEATRRFVETILLLKAGLHDPHKPLGSFLFMGPTGVGKTESALCLSEYLFGDRKRLVRFDMSEYAYPGSGLRFVDGPDGQGELTRRVRQEPFSVLLFDEVEKADPSVFDLLLQVLGEARLTDGTGRTVGFQHAIVVMTSNLGSRARPPLGFGGSAPASAYFEAAERFFRPELLNRLDHIVPFEPLDETSLAILARRLLEQALEREGFERRGLTIRFDDSVVKLVIREGTDPRYGARPMKRAVDTEVIVPLARLLARGTPESSALTLSAEGGSLAIV
jgi:ATP-dependent Clp protease ATP-binding subunit ClpC